MDVAWRKFLILGVLAVCACQPMKPSSARELKDGPPPNRDVSNIPNATPKAEAKSRFGNPPTYAVEGKTYHVLKSAKGYIERGVASWYGTKFHNHRTSSGEPYDVYGMSAAHRTLPLPTYVRVTNLENGREITVKVNDRGPFRKNRIIDLSYAAARKLKIAKNGTALVEIEALSSPNSVPRPKKIDRPQHLFLQVGAFSNRDNALKYAQKVADITQHDVELISTNEKNYTLYRVQVGPLNTVKQSDQLIALLDKRGYGKAIAVIH